MIRRAIFTGILALLVAISAGVGPAWAGTTGKLTGRVTDQTGAPLARVVVSAEPLGREGAKDAAAQTETDGAGRFVLDELSGEAYAIVASHAGLSPAVAPHVKVGTDLLLALGGGCVLRGRIADQSGTPVPAFSISCRLGTP